jgi:hypothetical protein
MAEFDGVAENERDLIIKLQGRIVALERFLNLLLIDMLTRHAKGSFEQAADDIAQGLLASTQRQEYETNAYTDAVWEEAGRVTRVQLDALIERGAALDKLVRGGQLKPL